MFDKTKNTDPKKKEFHLGFEFKNVNVTESLGQYVPLDMIKAKKRCTYRKSGVNSET